MTIEVVLPSRSWERFCDYLYNYSEAYPNQGFAGNDEYFLNFREDGGKTTIFLIRDGSKTVFGDLDSITWGWFPEGREYVVVNITMSGNGRFRFFVKEETE